MGAVPFTTRRDVALLAALEAACYQPLRDRYKRITVLPGFNFPEASGTCAVADC